MAEAKRITLSSRKRAALIAFFRGKRTQTSVAKVFGKDRTAFPGVTHQIFKQLVREGVVDIEQVLKSL